MTAALSDVLTPERLAALHALAAKYGVKDLRVFGSYARGEAKPESDLDLLVDIEYGRGVAMRLVHFQQEVRSLLGMRVDIVTADGLDKKLHARIFREARPLQSGMSQAAADQKPSSEPTQPSMTLENWRKNAVSVPLQKDSAFQDFASSLPKGTRLVSIELPKAK